MPLSPCLALHGVNPNLKKQIKQRSILFCNHVTQLREKLLNGIFCSLLFVLICIFLVSDKFTLKAKHVIIKANSILAESIQYSFQYHFLDIMYLVLNIMKILKNFFKSLDSTFE